MGALATALTALLLLGLVGVTWVGRVDRAPPAWLIALVTLLPYLYAGLMAWAFTLWSLLPDRVGPPVQLGVLVAVALGLWGPGLAARPEAGVGHEVRVMNWNLRRLWGGPDDGGEPVACAVKAVRAADPDVLALQEVSEEDVARLAQELGLSCRHTTYTGTSGPTRGGLAVCARGADWTLGEGGARWYLDGDDWRYAFAEVSRGDRVFNVLSVHLQPYELAMNDWLDVARQGEDVQRVQADQSVALLERMGKLQDPTLVAGDFNSTRDSALHVGLRRVLTDTWERGGLGLGGTVHLMDAFPLRVDYVYATDELAVQHAEVRPQGCSDHRAVVVDLVLQ